MPARFGSIVLLEEIGSGGMGAVYRGIDPGLDRAVAVKVLLDMTEGDQQKIEAFQREAKAAARLNHPNVANVYSFGVENGQPYIVMEYLKGHSLMGLIDEREALGEAAALQVILEAASGLSAASEEGLVHADVKPHNILFDKAGHAKLIDFGLALFAGDDAAAQGIWGSPYYIPPERIRREKMDLRSDIYSLGATLYHALAGRPPYDGDDLRSVCMAKLNEDVTPPSKYRHGLLPETDQLVCRMLRRNPRERYPNYASLISDIRKALQLASARPLSAVAAPQRPGAIDKAVKMVGGLTSRLLGKDVAATKKVLSRNLLRTTSRRPLSSLPAGAHSGSARSPSAARQEPTSTPAWIVPTVLAGGVALAMLVIWLSAGGGAKPTRHGQSSVAVKVRPDVELDEPSPRPRPAVTPVSDSTGIPRGSGSGAMSLRPNTGRVYTEAELALNARDDRYVVAPGGSIQCDVLQNDEWIGTNFASLASVAVPSNGTAVAQNGRVFYTARAGFTGSDAFTYTVRYPSGRISTATVAVVVGVENTTGGVALNTTSQTALTNEASTVTSGGAGGDTTDDRLGTVMACGENAPFEGKDKAFDNASDTKWLDRTPETWIEYAYASGISGRLTGYTITSASDAPERDPADWRLLGSNDGGTTWAVVDSRSNVVFSARLQKQTFALSGAPTCKAYRLHILKVVSPEWGTCQLAEIELLGEQVSIGGGVVETIKDYTLNGVNYRAHIFTGSGTTNKTFASAGPAEVLVVGGGGGGGACKSNGGSGGGGGAGGFRSISTNLSAGSYNVTVGAGGAGGMSASSRGANGGDSVFGDLTAAGGGGGGFGGSDTANPPRAGLAGGSGGGGGFNSGSAGAGNTPSVTPSQGNSGGDGGNNSPYSGGGGGGAGSVGVSGNGSCNGGDGVISQLRSGTNEYYSGGGGGGGEASAPGVGGLGGGGTGGRGSSSISPTAGQPNTGGGGGGAGGNSTQAGANGGSGIVIVRYVVSGRGQATAARPSTRGR